MDGNYIARILAIDDGPFFRTLLRVHLLQAGMRCEPQWTRSRAASLAAARIGANGVDTGDDCVRQAKSAYADGSGTAGRGWLPGEPVPERSAARNSWVLPDGVQ